MVLVFTAVIATEFHTFVFAAVILATLATTTVSFTKYTAPSSFDWVVAVSPQFTVAVVSTAVGATRSRVTVNAADVDSTKPPANTTDDLAVIE